MRCFDKTQLARFFCFKVAPLVGKMFLELRRQVLSIVVDLEIGMTISPKAVAYVLSDTEVEVKSYTLKPAKVEAGMAAYIKGYVKDNGDVFKTWSIDGWIPLCIKNDTLLMQQTLDDVTTIRYWKRR